MKSAVGEKKISLSNALQSQIEMTFGSSAGLGLSLPGFPSAHVDYLWPRDWCTGSLGGLGLGGCDIQAGPAGWGGVGLIAGQNVSDGFRSQGEHRGPLMKRQVWQQR